MRRILIALAVSITLLGFVAFELQATIGIGAKIGNAGAFAIINHVAGDLGIEVGIGIARVTERYGSFDELVPSCFLDGKRYFSLEPLRREILITPYIGAGVQGVRYDRFLASFGTVTITAVAAEVVCGLDICLPQLRVPITFIFAIYAHVVNGGVVSYAGGVTAIPFGTEVPKGFQLGIRIDF